MELEERDLSRRRRHVPMIDEQQITDFDTCLQRLGSWNTTGQSALHDGEPGIIRLQWIIPNELWCDEEGMLQFLDQRPHRQILRCFFYPSSLSDLDRTWIQKRLREGSEIETRQGRRYWTTEELLEKMGVQREKEKLLRILRFLMLQEYIISCGELWTSGPALASVYNIGSTLEWIVQAHFQRRHQAIARRCVHFKEWEPLGINDLDILAFPEDFVFIVECKSSTDITLGQLTRFVKRAQAFPADIALLLIDTESLLSVTARVDQIKTLLGSERADQEEHVQYEGSLIVFLPHNIYVANIGESIIHTLERILQIGRIHKGSSI